MTRSSHVVRHARQLAVLLLAVTAALFAVAGGAHGATRYKVDEDLPKPGGGVYLQNTISGYYLGRLFPERDVGGTVDPADTFRSQLSQPRDGRNDNRYDYGYAAGEAGLCAWIGPPGDLMNVTSFFGSPLRLRSRCPSLKSSAVGSKDWLKSRAHFGKDFNCPDKQARGPAQTTITKRAGFYYNLDWRASYRGGAGKDRSDLGGRGVLDPGITVLYRFTTRDGKKAVVYVPTFGWGFVDASKVDVVKGVWEIASDDPTADGTRGNEVGRQFACGEFPPR